MSNGSHNSKIVKFSRICNDMGSHTDRLVKRINTFIRLGYRSEGFINRIYFSVSQIHGLMEQFGIESEDILQYIPVV